MFVYLLERVGVRRNGQLPSGRELLFVFGFNSPSSLKYRIYSILSPQNKKWALRHNWGGTLYYWTSKGGSYRQNWAAQFKWEGLREDKGRKVRQGCWEGVYSIWAPLPCSHPGKQWGEPLLTNTSKSFTVYQALVYTRNQLAFLISLYWRNGCYIQ